MNNLYIHPLAYESYLKNYEQRVFMREKYLFVERLRKPVLDWIAIGLVFGMFLTLILMVVE